MNAEAAFREGDVVGGRYRIVRVVGQGGMGVVYAAEHLVLGEPVAVKVLHSYLAADAATVTRFVNEARAAFRIQGEHVVRVTDVGEHQQQPFLVMEYLVGEDLAQLLARTGPLPVQSAVAYVQQAIEGVAQAHAIGIVHRDLKPANLFLARRPDGTVVVKVLDFGISKFDELTFGGHQQLTSTRSMLGSPAFMSPEQLRSARHADVRSDIWALGVILYQLLTGRFPFAAETTNELFAAILEQVPAPVSVFRSEVPPWLDDVVRRCLQRRPEDRFQTVLELWRALCGAGSTASCLGQPRSLTSPVAAEQRIELVPIRALSTLPTRSTARAVVRTPARAELQAKVAAFPLCSAGQTDATASISSMMSRAGRSSRVVPLVIVSAFVALAGTAGALAVFATRPSPSASSATSASIRSVIEDERANLRLLVTSATAKLTPLAPTNTPSSVPSPLLSGAESPGAAASASASAIRRVDAPKPPTEARRVPAAPTLGVSTSLPSRGTEYDPWDAGRWGM